MDRKELKAALEAEGIDFPSKARWEQLVEAYATRKAPVEEQEAVEDGTD